MPRKSIIEISLSTLVFRPQMKFSWLRDERGHTGDRQKVGGSGTGDHRPTLCRTTLRINRLKGAVADLPQPSIFGPPTFWRSRVLVAQLPTSDWRDEQWVLGFGLFVNTIVFSYLRALGYTEKAELLRKQLGELEGMVIPKRSHYGLWSYKTYFSERFDLLGNSLAIISGLASHSRARRIILWVERECDMLRARGELVGALPPNLFPFITQQDPDWHSRYEIYNRPGQYHNGGVWPFTVGFYVAAIVAAGFPQLARRKLAALTALVRNARNPTLAFGFNEWIRANDGTLCGEDWQSWSAAMYLYAAACVEQKRILLF